MRITKKDLEGLGKFIEAGREARKGGPLSQSERESIGNHIRLYSAEDELAQSVMAEILQNLKPGYRILVSMGDFRNVFTRIQSIEEAIFGPQVSPIEVFREEYPDLKTTEIVDTDFGPSLIIEWKGERRVVRKRIPGPLPEDWSLASVEISSISMDERVEITEVWVCEDGRELPL